MVQFGVDIHPRYQAGISIGRIAAEGFSFMACKLSEGTSYSSWTGSREWLRLGKLTGMSCLGYHYLRAGNEDAQAAMFAEQLRINGVPGMIDAEDGAGTITNIRRFADACRRHGAHTPLLYLPHWYWVRIGRPNLAGLPALWASHYVSGSDYASTLYARVPASWWSPYGGGRVEVLQFSDRGRVAGKAIDVNAYRGTAAQFAALIGGTSQQEDDMPTAQEVAAAVWDAPMHSRVPGSKFVGRAGGFLELIDAATFDTKARAIAIERRFSAMQATITSLAQALAAQQQLDAEQIRDAVVSAIEASVLDVEVTVRDELAARATAIADDAAAQPDDSR